MSSINNVVNIQISLDTATISRAGFGTVAILGKVGNVTFTESIRYYTSYAAVESDFNDSLIGQEELDMANRLFSQELKPTKIAIIKSNTRVAQISTVAIDTVSNSTLYRITLNGTAFEFVSDASATQAEIADGLVAAINAGTEPVTASNSSDDVLLTSDNAGEGFTVSLNDGTLMSYTTGTANVGASSDLQAAIDENDDFYALVMVSKTDGDIMDLAYKVETLRKIFIARSDDSDIPTAATDDIASRIKAKSLNRTFGFYSTDEASFPDAALFGNVMPKDAGTVNWALKTLVGITADNLTDTQEAYLKAKNCSYYVTIGGVGVTQGVKAGSGEWADIVRGADWLDARMTEEVYALLLANDKIPFTDGGISMVGNAMRGPLEQAKARGFLASPDAEGKVPAYEITLPAISSFSTAEKQARILTGITFIGRVAGAVNAVEITGNVTVSAS